MRRVTSCGTKNEYCQRVPSVKSESDFIRREWRDKTAVLFGRKKPVCWVEEVFEISRAPRNFDSPFAYSNPKSGQ